MTNDLTRTDNAVARSEQPETTAGRRLYRPVTDIYEKDGGVFVVTELPGVEADSVDVTLEKRVLTIRASAPDKPREGYRPVHVEYGEGDYERVFTISEEIDQDAMKASFRNGVLTLELPRSAAAQPKKIDVMAG